MDFSTDNHKAGEIDNVTQTLLSNANTGIKLEMDETNGIFGATGEHHHISDKLNNKIDMNNVKNPFTDFIKEGNENNTIDNRGHDVLLGMEKACLENEGDMGPETSVDTTDDADVDTEPYECSTLSHSKETLPSSDNPFDGKIPHQIFDQDDFNIHDKHTAPASPSADSPLDTQMTEMHEEHVYFENVSPSEVMLGVGKHDEKDELQLGADHFKTDYATHEIRQKTLQSNQVTDFDTLDEIMTSAEPQADKQKEIDFCGSIDTLRKSDDLKAYEQFAEFIQEPAQQHLTTPLQQVPEQHFEDTASRLSQHLDFKMNDGDAEKSVSPGPDTPTSESSAPGSLVPHTDLDSFVLHDQLHEHDKPTQVLIEEAEISFEKTTGHDNELAMFSDHEKQTDDVFERKKDIDESSEQSEKLVDELNELNKREPMEWSEGNEEKKDAVEKTINDCTEDSDYMSISKDIDNYVYSNESEGKYLGVLDEQCELQLDNKSPVTGTFGFEPKKENTETFENIGYSNESEGNYLGKLDEHFNLEFGNKPPIAPRKENKDDFGGFGFSDESELNYPGKLEEHFNRPSVEESFGGFVTKEEDSMIHEEVSDDAHISPKTFLEHQAMPASKQEDYEGHMERKLNESPVEHAAESNNEHLSMEEEFTSEKPLTTTDDNVCDSHLELRNEEQANENKLPSLEHNEPSHIKTDSELIEDVKSEPQKESDILETKSKETDLALVEGSQDESLDEWSYTKPKGGESEEKAVENIESEEKTQQTKSQETEESNRKEVKENKSVAEKSDKYLDEDTAEDKEVEDMTSQLNPEAKEFVPGSSPIAFDSNKSGLFSVSPQHVINGDGEMAHSPTKIVFPQLDKYVKDDVVAQSPHKAIPMDDIQMPTASEFETEILSRPSEFSVSEALQELNLKEAMHEPEKEQESPVKQYDNSLNETPPSDDSLGKIEDKLNTVQPLPNEDEMEIDVVKANGGLLADANINGVVPLIAELSNLKLEEPKIVTDEKSPKAKIEKVTKTPEGKKTDVKPKTSSTGPKKTISSTSTTTSDSAKIKSAATASKTKVSASAPSTRPRTAPAHSAKPQSTEKKATATFLSARAKPDVKPAPIGLKKLPLTKLKPEESKTSARLTTSKLSSTVKTTPTTRIASTTSTTNTTAKRTNLSTTTSSATRTTSGPRPTLSPISKPNAVTSTHKPAISPRSTVTSTLRKTEVLKSPTTATKSTTAKTATTTSTSTVSKTTTRTSTGSTSTRATTLTATKKTSNTATTKPAAPAATKKPIGIKKPLGTTVTATKQKTSDANSLSINATATPESSEIKMNGTTAPVATTNGESVEIKE